MIENFQKEGAQHLARDGLAPKHEEDKSAIQQMLKKFRKNVKDANSTAKARSSDVCFRCHKQGHWTIDCLERHEPEYLAKQNCYSCVKKGNFTVACPNKIKTDDQFKTKSKKIKPPVVKSACYQTGTTLVKLFVNNLSLKSLDDFEFYKSISSQNSSNYDSKFHKQRRAEWFNAHKGKISGRKAAAALGWYG